MAEPRFRDHIPDDRRKRREEDDSLAAEHFDHLNIIAGFDQLPHNVRVVKESCEKIDRYPGTLETSTLVMAIIDETVTTDQIPDDFKQQAVFGGPEQVVEQLKTKVLDAGVDGVVLSPITSLSGYIAAASPRSRKS